MTEAIVITPVKDSLETTLTTISAISKSITPVHHVVYNDFSTAETKAGLEQISKEIDFELIHLEDLTDHPSPNYKLVLQVAQQRAVKEGVPLIVVESDVVIEPDTIQRMLDFYKQHPDTGLLGAVTVDEEGKVNFPYLKFKNKKPQSGYTQTGKSLSFCCTLMSNQLLQQYNFADLDDSKHWYDTFLSDEAVRLGMRNFVLTGTPVLHKPHGSRPWKLLKYSNPLKYYFLKLIKNRDKI